MDWYVDLMDGIAERLEALPVVVWRTVSEPQFHMSEAIMLTAILALLVLIVVLAILYWVLGSGKKRTTRSGRVRKSGKRKEL